ncbi:gypsy retrotransposon integrase-like protein 1 isoform X3 [Pungitius pungitius]|uniref:gypsy retrotransposon integrase-like protein 1 isoform X3 n=1 Tax=Pungitius pungitius TaxID=134920 RepID=UPI001887873A|nr:gypsy retrotransposon integrase-like protein 1 isoform X3 [Pungitius pungitius]
MLSVESLQVVEEEVVESSSNKLGDIYTFVAKGCFPQTMNPLRKKNLKRYAQKFVIDEGKLYYVGPKKEEKREVVIEAERKRQVFLDCHFNDVGHHLGQKKTVHRIQSKYYWLGIIKDVVDWIKVCETCQHTERNKNLARTVRPIKVDAPWDIVGIDMTGPFPETQQGNTSVTLLIDYFSKWPEAFPVQKTDALSVAKCISKCIYRFGAPKTIVCTQNVDFCDEVEHRAEGVSTGSTSAQPLARLHESFAEGGHPADGNREAGGMGRLPGPRAVPLQDVRQPNDQVQPLLAHVQQESEFTRREYLESAQLRRAGAGHAFHKGEGLGIYDDNAGAAELGEAAGDGQYERCLQTREEKEHQAENTQHALSDF